MSSDTSLVFDLVARDRASAALRSMREKFTAASSAIGVGVATALGVGVAANLNMEAANDKLAAQLGAGPAEAAELSKVSASVYMNAWGDSTETVNEAIKGVYQNIGDTSAAEGGLEGVTTKALALADTFNQDLGVTTAAAGQLMRTGLADSADEAFDIITTGLGSSADKSGDFLETLNEYSTQWRRIGLDGQTATGLLAQGLKAGARDADQVADALGQFGERALAGGGAVDDAFKSLGLNADDMAAKIGAGGDSASDALGTTLDALRGTTDEQVKLNAAAALFGDPGNVMGDALFALDPATAAASAGMDKAAGSTDKLVTTMGGNAAATLESFKRQAVMKLSEVAGVFVGFAMDNQQVMMPLAATLAGIAATVLVVRGAMMAWTAAQAIWTAATTVATAVQWAYNAAMAANPIVLIIIAVIAVIAVIVLLWKKNEAFRNFFISAWNMIWGAIKFVWNWVKQNWPMLLAVITGPIGMAVYAVIKYWDTISSATAAVWRAIWGWVKAIPGKIYNLWLNWTLPGLIFKHWGAIKSGTIRVATSMLDWVKRLPGRIIDAVASLGARLYTTGSNAWNRFKRANIVVAGQAIDWVRGLPKRVTSAVGDLSSRLYNAGRSLLMGFWNGIKSYASTLNNNVSGVVGKVRDFFPFSPARKGPFSGSGYTTYSGQKLITDFARGITSRSAVATEAMTGVVAGVSGAGTQGVTSARATAAPMRRTAQVVRVVVDVTGGDGELKKVIRKWVRVDGGGNAQKFFGG